MTPAQVLSATAHYAMCHVPCRPAGSPERLLLDLDFNTLVTPRLSEPLVKPAAACLPPLAPISVTVAQQELPLLMVQEQSLWQGCKSPVLPPHTPRLPQDSTQLPRGEHKQNMLFLL